MEQAKSPLSRKKLGQLLEEGGWIDPSELKKALAAQRGTGRRLGEILVEQGVIAEKIVLDTLSRLKSVAVVDLDKVEVSSEAILALPYEAARKYRCLPLRKEGRTLHVAMADPCNQDQVQDISFVTGMRVRPYLCSSRDIDVAIEHYYGREGALENVVEGIANEAQLEWISVTLDDQEEGVAEKDAEAGQKKTRPSAPPIVRLVNLILVEAIKKEASDIHFEPAKTCLRVRFRMDGHLRTRMEIPKYLQGPLISRIKVMARMDIANKRTPQDGGIRVAVAAKSVDLRVSSLPANYGEKIVVRVLDQAARQTDLAALGLNAGDVEKLGACYRRPQGMILVTGPTGSGKSTTLHALLKLLRSDASNIVTVEDPIEYELEGVNQVQVCREAGMDFASCLRAILRQDPDVIMVGEIRDRETAEVAIRASLTGHLVFSTLHTQDTTSTVTRLLDIGIKEYLLRSSLVAVIAQRLVRRICPECRIDYTLDEATYQSVEPYGLKGPHLYRGRGCPSCDGSGFRGRIGLFEVMLVDGPLRESIAPGISEARLRELARESGMKTLFEDGMEKVSNGVTTLEEVFSVARPESIRSKGCPGCRRRVEPSHTFCPYCGRRISKNCSTCGFLVKDDWRICPSCAAPLHHEGSRVEPSLDSPSLVPETSQDGAPA